MSTVSYIKKSFRALHWNCNIIHRFCLMGHYRLSRFLTIRSKIGIACPYGIFVIRASGIWSADRHGLWHKAQKQEKTRITEDIQKLTGMTLAKAVTSARDSITAQIGAWRHGQSAYWLIRTMMTTQHFWVNPIRNLIRTTISSLLNGCQHRNLKNDFYLHSDCFLGEILHN